MLQSPSLPDAAILAANSSVLVQGVDIHIIQSSLPHNMVGTSKHNSFICL